MAAFIKISMPLKQITVLIPFLISLFMTPSFLFAEDSTQTYDRESIRYPSMNTGQVWAKIGKDSIAPLNQEPQLMKNGVIQDVETKRIKKTPSKTSRPAYKKENQKAATNKSAPTNKVHLAKGTTSEAAKSDWNGKNRQLKHELYNSEIQRSDQSGKNWHHKQELYDVDCGEKLARVVVTYYFDRKETILRSSQTPDAKWYHIYPGSFEEQLYTEICNPR